MHCPSEVYLLKWSAPWSITQLPLWLQAGTRDVAEVYAEEGIESCSGMTWRQQEQLRERQQDAEIAARVLAFTSAPFRIPLPPSQR